MSRKCGKSWKYKLCGIAYRKRKFARKFSCVRNSMREVYMILNPAPHGIPSPAGLPALTGIPFSETGEVE